MQFFCSPRKLQLFSTFVATFVIVVVLIILFLYNWPSFARHRVIEAMLFKNGTIEMDRFTTTSDLKNLRLSISVYSVKNPQEVAISSAKIELQELGPFVYHEFKTKELLENNQATGLISYKLRRQFIFKPELSVGDPKKINLTWINVPVISAISIINKMNFPKKIAARFILNQAISAVKEEPFITDTIDNFIFSGSYRELFAQPLLKPFVPKKSLPDSKFAVLLNRNNTWLPERDYILTSSAGFGPGHTYRDLNQYVLMNGSARLPFWKSESRCNDLQGTDGEFFSPFVNSSKNLEIYSMDICRRLSLKYGGETVMNGINVYKYTLDEKSLQSGSKNPENECYCIGNPSTDCYLDGVIDLSTCIADEVVASGAHFLYGSPELTTRVSGVTQPKTINDEPIFYVEPNTGLSIQVKVPLQINVRLKTSEGYNIFNFFKESQPVIVPLLTVTEAADLTDEQATMLRSKLLILDSWFVSMVLGGSIMLILVIILVIVVLCVRYRNSRQQAQELRAPSETDPLLPRTSQQTVENEGEGG